MNLTKVSINIFRRWEKSVIYITTGWLVVSNYVLMTSN